MEKINIIRSQTWLKDDFENITDILEEAIKDFVDENDEIINIESKESENGLSRFWIYVKSKGEPKNNTTIISSGDKVRMSVSCKEGLIDNGCGEHVNEFGYCVGVVEDFVNLNNNGENDINKIGPEFNVRWMPSNLRYAYLPEHLVKVGEVKEERITYDCKVCGKPFGDKLSLWEHYDSEHN